MLGVVLEDAYRDRMMGDFAAVEGRELVSVRLDHKRQRRAELFVGEGFAPKPRTGLLSAPPTPP